jgi:peptidyl-prolyl cis-trans isomerase B (cyclophilin B)
MKYLLLIMLALCLCTGPRKESVSGIATKDKEINMNIQVTGYGTIVIKLHEKEAPNNVANIVKLVNNNFYNGLKFHRVIKGFVIQGGCPKGDGTGDPGYELADEIVPNLKHLKGTVAMANRGPNTNGSQFYICLAPQPRLDGGYTVIGEVVEGIEVVEKIGEAKTSGPPMDRPIKDIIMEKVWIEEK